MSNLWFKAKHYGWGWYPATWQGWLVILIYTACVVRITTTFQLETSTPKEAFFHIGLPLIALSALLIAISYLKGEQPRWRWRKKD